MATPNLVLYIVLIWCVSSVHLASQNRCRHHATLYIDWKKVDHSTLIPQYDSGIVFDVLRNHCIEIILENIDAHMISCETALLNGGTAAASSFNARSGATIKIDSITDTMSTKWKCDSIDQNIRILFELKVKGAKRVKMEINNQRTPFTISGLDEPKYDGVMVFAYDKPRHVHVKCKNEKGDITLIFCSYVDSGMKECIKKTEIDVWLQEYHDIAYIDCILYNKGLKQSFVYGYIFKFNGTKRYTSSMKPLMTTTTTTESSGYEHHKNIRIPSINHQFNENPPENYTRPIISSRGLAKEAEQKTCNKSICGPNSKCREIKNHAICSCIPGYIGAPPICRPECVISSECLQNQACVNQKCINPCIGTTYPCGLRATCNVVNHAPLCACPAMLTGDPFVMCTFITNTVMPGHTDTSDYIYNNNSKVPSRNDDQYTEQPLENYTPVTTLVIACGAGIIAVGIIACYIVLWCRRKRNANILKNELMELSFEDESATPQPQSQVDSNVYDYAYNMSNNITSTRPLPPCSCQKSLASHLKKDSIPSDEESNYYSEIDEYFINKRNIRQQK